MRWSLLLIAPLLAACSLFAAEDRYGNEYGDWYNPGQQYRWQLATCDGEISGLVIPETQRKLAMRCCMWRHGVPIDDPASCFAPPRG